MPIGISFYTFQALSYVIDVYRREVPPQHDPFSLALYVSMFPQLIAGPIVRYHDVNVQLAVRKHSFHSFPRGISRFLFGLSKKVLLSMYLRRLRTAYSNMHRATVCRRCVDGRDWLHAADLLRFLRLLGYGDRSRQNVRLRVSRNFNYPYISKVGHRVLAPLAYLAVHLVPRLCVHSAGRQPVLARTAHFQSLLAVWTLTGFWHGANWTFMAWGLYFGMLLILEKKFLAGWITRLPSVLQHLYALFFIVIGWVFFRSDSMGLAVRYLGSMFTSTVPLNRFVIEYLLRFWPYLLFGVVLSAPVFPRLKVHPYMACTGVSDAGCLVHAVPDVRLLASSYNPFIYFRFWRRLRP